MFWKYNNTNSNHIETLLNNPDVTLQELMDEEDILQECKAQNKKLVDFLCRPEVMEQLVTFATVEPPANIDEKSRFKYPNVACELLTCDIPTINEHLAANEPLSKLYAFLEGNPPLNPLLASFFSKILGILVARKSEQHWYLYQITCLKVLEFLQSKENCISLLLAHLGTSAVMDLMLKLITQIEGTEIRQNLINWLENQRVIPSLIALLKPDIDCDRHSNVSQLLSDVIRKSRENSINSPSPDPDPILVSLEKQETASELLEYMLSGEAKSESGIVGGIAVLLTLIEIPLPRATETATYADESTTPNKEEESPPVPLVVHTTISAILPRLKDFHDLLLNPPQKPPVKTTVGTLDPPLGNTRLQVARLIAALITTNSPAINQELASLGTMEILLDLFFKYQWNNFLHTQVELCIASALRHQTKASGDGDPQLHCLVENLLVKCELLRRILDAWEENETNQAQEKRRGYMGHLIKIANLVVDLVEKCSLRPILAKLLPPEVLAVWEEFVSCTLSEINKTHNIALGGAPPTQNMGLDKEEANFKHVAFQPDTSLHQAFTDYQLQEMAPDFIEDYGFHDNEFNDPEDTLHSSVDRLPDMAVTLNEDVDRQYEWFKHVCAKNLRSLEDAEENAWEDTNLGSFQTSENEASGWKMEKEGPDHSSSDEEEEDDVKEESEIRRPAKTDVRMDVDVIDIWSSGAATLDTIADFQNPWGSGSPAGPPADSFGSSDGGWADFSSFETNFSSSTQLNDGKKAQDTSALSDEDMPSKVDTEDLKQAEKAGSVDSESVTVDVFPPTSEITMEELQVSDSSGSDSSPNAAGVSFVEADANANPTSSADDVTSLATAMVDEVATAAVAAVRVVVADKLGLDNQRFLGGSQIENDASAQVDSGEDTHVPVASEDQQEKREAESSAAEDLSSEAV